MAINKSKVKKLESLLREAFQLSLYLQDSRGIKGYQESEIISLMKSVGDAHCRAIAIKDKYAPEKAKDVSHE